MKRDTPFPLYAPVHILYDLLPPHSPVAYVLNGWPISQPKDKWEHLNIAFTENVNIRKKILYGKINGSAECNNIQGSSINQKPNNTMSVILFTGATHINNSVIVPWSLIWINASKFYSF